MNVALTPPQVTFGRLSRVEAESLLQLGRRPLATLEAAGCLPDLRVDRVAALASRQWATADEPLVVVRCGRSTEDDDGRKIGYAQGPGPSGYTDAEVRESARQWWVSDPDAVVAAGHILVVVATFVVALLQVTDVADDITVTTERGNTVRRWSYEATLLARVDDLVAGAVRRAAPVPVALKPLVAVLGQRVASPPGAPLIVTQP